MTKYYVYIYKSTNIYTRVSHQTTHTHTPSHMHAHSMHKYTVYPSGHVHVQKYKHTVTHVPHASHFAYTCAQPLTCLYTCHRANELPTNARVYPRTHNHSCAHTCRPKHTCVHTYMCVDAQMHRSHGLYRG